MRKIINGKKYDTDTAKMLGEDSNGYPTDFNYEREELYKKKTGEFFLYGTGGANSKYAVSNGDNSYSGGDRITPIDEERAKKWCEAHLSVDEYEEIWGEVEE